MAKRTRTRSASGGLMDRLNQYLTTERAIIAGSIVFTVIIVAVILVSSAGNQTPDIGDIDPATPDNSVTVPVQSRDHIGPGQEHPAYNSNPPTSGWHYPNPARAGVYQEVLPDETVIHNLEHGHIWLSYRDANDEDAIELLTDLEDEFSDWVIVTHRPNNDSRVAAAAWGRLLIPEELDEDELRAFIVRYRNKAPESIPG